MSYVYFLGAGYRTRDQPNLPPPPIPFIVVKPYECSQPVV